MILCSKQNILDRNLKILNSILHKKKIIYKIINCKVEDEANRELMMEE